MNKAIIIIALLVAVFAYAEANRCQRHCRKNVHSPVRCVKQGAICRKIRQCAIDEENCRRRQAKQPRITSTSLSYCRNIKGHEGKGRCAYKKRVPRSIKRRCSHLKKCPSGSHQKYNCYSSKRGNCQLLSPCQVERVNCQRGKQGRLEWVDLRRCYGMKPGQKRRKCKPGHKRS